jgi:S1-C subfamily serine protease
MGDSMGGFVTVLVRTLFVSCLLLGLTGVAGAQPSQGPTGPRLGFSNLVVRIQGDDFIGLAPDTHRVDILEALRAAQFNVVGAENIVFGEDRSRLADLLLGGTVRELECGYLKRELNCRIGIEWLVLDVETHQVVYSVLSRYGEFIPRGTQAGAAGRALVLGALRSLMARARFRHVVAQLARPTAAAPSYPPATFSTCPTAAVPMPGGSEGVLNGAVLVEAGPGFGSGFFLSNDGLVLTAAHVLRSPQLTVHLRDGTRRPARVIRRADDVDVALLDIGVSPTAMPCLPLATGPLPTGSDVYAVGAPASQRLAFSLSRGIVSGSRMIDGRELLQTDASVSPGNSGGPMVDAQGNVVALVSWKVAGAAVEGVAFGVPIDAALRALGLRAALSTDPALHQPSAPASVPFYQPIVDVPDPDPLAAEFGEKKKPRKKLPTHVAVLRYGGAIVAGVGAAGVLLSWSAYLGDGQEGQVTRDRFETQRQVNNWSWVMVGVGAAAFGVSLFLPRESADEKKDPAKASSATRFSVGVGLGSLRTEVRF